MQMEHNIFETNFNSMILKIVILFNFLFKIYFKGIVIYK